MPIGRLFSLLCLLLVPGGLVLFAAWLWASAVAAQLRLEPGQGRRRLASAVGHVHWRDVWGQARHQLRASP